MPYTTVRTISARARAQLVGALLALLVGWQSGCSRARSSEPSGEAEPTELRYQGQPGVVTFPELAADLGYLAPLELNHVGSTISGPQDIQTVATGDIEFGLAFHGAILKLVAAKAPIQAVIGGYGVDEQTFSSFFVLADSPIKSARDLIGKRVAMNTLGAHILWARVGATRRGACSKSSSRPIERCRRVSGNRDARRASPRGSLTFTELRRTDASSRVLGLAAPRERIAAQLVAHVA